MGASAGIGSEPMGALAGFESLRTGSGEQPDMVAAIPFSLPEAPA
jgi:hypothetical protein